MINHVAAGRLNRPTRSLRGRCAPKRVFLPSTIEATGRTVCGTWDPSAKTWMIGVDVASPSVWDQRSHCFRNYGAGGGWDGSTMATAYKKSPFVYRDAAQMVWLAGSNGTGGIYKRVPSTDAAATLDTTTYYGQVDEGGSSDPRTAGSRLGCPLGTRFFLAVTRTAAPARGIIKRDTVGGSWVAWAFATSRNWTAVQPSPQFQCLYGTADGTVGSADGVWILTGVTAGTATLTRIDNVGSGAPASLVDVRDVTVAYIGTTDYLYVTVGNKAGSDANSGVWECAISHDPTDGAFNTATHVTWRHIFTPDSLASDRPQSCAVWQATPGTSTIIAFLGLFNAATNATGTYLESNGTSNNYRRTHYRCLDARAGSPSWTIVSNAANVNINTDGIDFKDHPHVISLTGEATQERGRIGGANHQVQSVAWAADRSEVITVGKTTPWICRNPLATTPIWRPFANGLGALSGGYQAIIINERSQGLLAFTDDDRGGWHVDWASPPLFVWCLADDATGIAGTNNATYTVAKSVNGVEAANGGVLYGARLSQGLKVTNPFTTRGAVFAPTVSFVGISSYVNVNGTSITIPFSGTSWAPGDTAYAFMSNRSTTGVWNNPAGWTFVANKTQGTNLEAACYARKLVNGDTDPVFTHDTTGTLQGVMVVVRGTGAGTSLDGAEVDEASIAAASFVTTGITTVTDGAAVLVVGFSADDNALSVAGTGFTTLFSGASFDGGFAGVDSAMAGTFKQMPTAGAAGAVTFTQTVNGNDPWVTMSVPIKPTGPTAAQVTTVVKDYSVIFSGAQNNCIGFFDFLDGSANYRYLGADSGRGIIRSAAGGGSPDTIVQAFTSGANRTTLLTNSSGVFWLCVPDKGIYRSSDYCATWTLWWDKSMNSTQARWSGHIANDPSSPNTLWVTFDDGGVWKVTNAHTSTAGSGSAGLVPSGAAKVTGGSLAGTERMGPIAVDPFNHDVWAIQHPSAGATPAGLHRLPHGSGTTWIIGTDNEIKEGAQLAQEMTVFAGVILVATSGQGLLRRSP